MTNDDSVATRLWLGLKRYWYIVLIPAVLATGLAYGAAARSSDALYDATSVIVASDLKIRPEGLPRFAESVFAGGEVARGAAVGLPYDAADLIPDRVRLEPFENTVVLEVVGTDPDPRLAARIANEVAESFVAELNEPGPTLGIFVIQSRAQVPTAPVAQAGGAIAVVLGVAAGVLIGVGALLLLLVVRRPVLTASDAASASNAQVLTTLRLPRRRDFRRPPPPGTAALARRLFPERSGMAALLSPTGSAAARTQIAIAIARVLAPSGPTHLVADLDGDSKRALTTRTLTVSPDIPGGRAWAAAPIVIDGPSEFDLPALYPPNARLALVVQAGTPARSLAETAQTLLPDELTGVILVHGTGRLRLLPPTKGRERRGDASETSVGARLPTEPQRARQPSQPSEPEPTRTQGSR